MPSDVPIEHPVVIDRVRPVVGMRRHRQLVPLERVPVIELRVRGGKSRRDVGARFCRGESEAGVVQHESERSVGARPLRYFRVMKN